MNDHPQVLDRLVQAGTSGGLLLYLKRRGGKVCQDRD